MEWSERRGRRREAKGRERGGKREGEGRRGGEEEERREREGGRGGEEEKKEEKVPILHSEYVCLSCFNSHCPTRA